ECNPSAVAVVSTDGPTNDGCSFSQTWTATYQGVCDAAASVSIMHSWKEDLERPVIVIVEHADSVCNATPYPLIASWTDNCSEGDELSEMPVVVPADPTDPNQCVDYWVYTFTAMDDCGNDTIVMDTIIKFTESEGDCETAFAMNDKDALCFLYDVENDFSRWGWTNKITVGITDTLDVYAGAGQCDLSKGTWVGTVELSFGDDTMYVNYDLMDGYVMSEAHIYAGVEKYPGIKNGKHKGEPTVAPGQYTVVWEQGDPATELKVALTNLPEGTTEIYVIVHSVVCVPTCDCPETIRTGVELASASILTIKGNKNKAAVIQPEASFDESELKVYPNPFSEKVTFEFVSRVNAYGVLELYNVTGQRVARLLDRPVQAGENNKVEYIPAEAVSGVYIYRLDLDGEVKVGRVIYRE
ncbi:T9SS type A sorting domain-containing protein, partial [Prolixibacteraceae bacterium Z1-6]|nr:T9SS type A sorting domain-containing protein [Prolixibacteraceae bacterium Z1-6]